MPSFIALGIYFLFGTKFSWNEGTDTCFSVECVLLGCNFDFLGGYLVTACYLVVTTGYCSLPDGYCSLLVVSMNAFLWDFCHLFPVLFYNSNTSVNDSF